MPSEAVQNAVQEGKIHSAWLQIKEQVREATDQDPANIRSREEDQDEAYAVGKSRLFAPSCGEEKSFRASYAAMTIVAYLSRMIVEVDDYNQKAGSAYLEKPHADALNYLLTTLDRLKTEAEQLMAVARARGLADEPAVLQVSIDKLSD
jgi:hypothetical protein